MSSVRQPYSSLYKVSIEVFQTLFTHRTVFLPYSDIQLPLNLDSYQPISQFPRVLDNFDLDNQAPIPFSRLVDL